MNVAEESRRSRAQGLPRAAVLPKVMLLLAALCLTGCAVNQDKEVATYRRVLDGRRPVEAFEIKRGEPLSLEAALLLANRNSEELATSGENYLQALIDRERVFANFLPNISLSPRFNWTERTSPGGHRDTLETASGAQYNIFNGFQDIAALRETGYTADQRKALLLDLQQTTLLNVATTYFEILSSERQVLVLRNSVDVQNERLRDTQARMAAGIAKNLDVAQTAAQAAATRVDLISAQNNVRTTRALLAFLTSAPVQDSPLADRIQVPEHLPSTDDLIREAQIHRQDAQAAEAQIEAARQGVQAAIGQYYPSITLNVNYILQRQNIPGVGEWQGILSANLPIFTGGVIHANVRTAWSFLRIAWLNQRNTRRLTAEQVQVAFENLEDSRRRIAELHVEVDAAQEALRQAESTYAVGLGTNLDRLTAQNQLLSAQLSLVREEFNFKTFYLNLLRSQGMLPLPDTLGPPPGTPTSQPTLKEVTTPGPVRTVR